MYNLVPSFQNSRLRIAIIFGIFSIAFFLSACAHFGAAPEEDRFAPGIHYASINGATIAYHVHGKGPACIIVAGGPGFWWNYLRMPELEKTLTLVYLEPVGTGKSDRLQNPAGYTIQRYVDDIEELRKHIGLEKFYLLGHSAGGYVAQAYAVEHSEHLQGLILYDASPVLTKEWMDDFGQNLGWFSKEPWFAEALEAFKHIPAVETDEETHRIMQKAIGFYVADYGKIKNRADAYAKEVFISAKPWRSFLVESPSLDIREQLYRIAAPTLIITGRKDAAVGMKFAEMIKERIPDSRMVIFEHSGHLAHFEEPKAFADAVSGFAGDIESTHAGK